jgi:hypothetical protein
MNGQQFQGMAAPAAFGTGLSFHLARPLIAWKVTNSFTLFVFPSSCQRKKGRFEPGVLDQDDTGYPIPINPGSKVRIRPFSSTSPRLRRPFKV